MNGKPSVKLFFRPTILVIFLFSLIFNPMSLPVQAGVVEEGPEAVTALPVVDTFEGGIPAGFVGFADSWDGSGSSTTLALAADTLARPVLPDAPTNGVAEVTYNIAAAGGWGGGPGYGGVSRDFTDPQDWSTYGGFSFWFYGNNNGAEIRVELKSDGAAAGASNRFVWGFSDDFSGWKYLAIPFSSFVNRTDYNPGPNPAAPINLAKMWGYSILLPGGSAGSFAMDQVEVLGYSELIDFESGVPAGFVGFADSWDGTGSSTTLAMGNPSLGIPVLPEVAANKVVEVTYNIAASGGWGGGPGYGGVSHDFSPFQDWSAYQGFSLWFHGGNSGAEIRVELKSDGAGAGASNRFVWGFTDNFSGWKYLEMPFSSFVNRTDYNPGPNPAAPINLAKMWGYSILLPGGSAGTFAMDRVAAYGRSQDLVVTLSSETYTVDEGGTATITAVLSSSAGSEITVDFATADGTAQAGSDYTANSGTLTFAPGVTSQTFEVVTSDDSDYEKGETVTLTLSNAAGARLGAKNTATLTIFDNDMAPDSALVEDFEAGAPTNQDPFGNGIDFTPWGNVPGNLSLDTQAVPAGDPLALPGQSGANTVLKVSYNIDGWGGFTHAFSEDGYWGSQDWSRYDGMRFWLYGNNTGGTVQIDLFDNQARNTTGDSAERYYYRVKDDYTGWKRFSLDFAAFQRRSDWQPGGAPSDGLNLTEVSGYAFGFPTGAGAQVAYIDQVELYGKVQPGAARANFMAYAFSVVEGQTATVKVTLNGPAAAPVSLSYSLTPQTATAGVDFTAPLTGTLSFAAGEQAKTFTIQTLEDSRDEADERINLALADPTGAVLGWKDVAPLFIRDNDLPDPAVVEDFEAGLRYDLNPWAAAGGTVTVEAQEVAAGAPLAIPWQDPINTILKAIYNLPANVAGGIGHEFALARDWSSEKGLSFWFRGSNSGSPVTLQLLDNRTPDPGPSGWTLAWSDEFEGEANAAPDPRKWGYDLGGAGWGNAEWEYYTDSRENSALDGAGNLVITAKKDDTAQLDCWYGKCTHTSARLLTMNKFEFAYGRAEARLKVPYGQGIWPAFWMLGGNFAQAGWPNCGEIDIMENIGKEPNTVHGTIHGPGYSGGSGIGAGYDLPAALSEDYHVFAVEWEPQEIRWYIDGILYNTVTPANLPAGTTWVFDHPFFIILNVAVGGYWPGYPDDTTTFPQTMHVDYVRVYQRPADAEQFEFAFTDNFAGWQQIFVPFSSLARSANQPQGAPDDGLTLSEVWGYRFNLPGGKSGTFYLDQVRLFSSPPNRFYLPLVGNNK